MEPLSLASSIAGLHSVCIDILERIDAYEKYGPDSRAAVARFDGNKLRLKSWADSVGIRKGEFADMHHPSLDQPEINLGVKTILQSVIETATEIEQSQGNLHLTTSPQHVTATLLPEQRAGDHRKYKERSQMPRLDGIRCTWRRGRFLSQVDTFGSLVDLLYPLILPRDSRQLAPSAGEQGLITGNS